MVFSSCWDDGGGSCSRQRQSAQWDVNIRGGSS